MTASARITEMAIYEPGERRKAIKVLLPLSLAEELELIARVRDDVEKAVGDKTEWSPTRMMREAATDIVSAQFAEWGGKPKNEKAVRELTDRLIAASSATTSDKR